MSHILAKSQCFYKTLKYVRYSELGTSSSRQNEFMVIVAHGFYKYCDTTSSLINE